MSDWRILGIEDSDGEKCECCGTCCPKRRVVLSDGDIEKRFGVNCAAIAVHGEKTSANAIKVLNRAMAFRFRSEKLAAGWDLVDIARVIRNKWANCNVVNGDVVIA